jgi:aryl-alcohol dehydrogenase-like predicted oxidoreductase
MDHRRIGSLSVSVVGLGCNSLGTYADSDESIRLVHTALDCGIDFFDTADMYGAGASESLLGRALRGRRNSVVIATKVGMQVGDDPAKSGAHPARIAEAAIESLRRLDTSYVDLYQLHEPDPDVPIEESLGAMAELVESGEVRQIGCSNLNAEEIRVAASSHRRWEVASIQSEYSLLNRSAEHSILPSAIAAGWAFIPYFPLAGGVLTGKYRSAEQPLPETRLAANEGWRKRFLTHDSVAAAQRLSRWAGGRERSVAALALTWLLAQPSVPSVIPGASSAAQVRANVSAADWQLTPDDLTHIDRILRNEPV